MQRSDAERVAKRAVGRVARRRWCAAPICISVLATAAAMLSSYSPNRQGNVTLGSSRSADAARLLGGRLPTSNSLAGSPIGHAERTRSADLPLAFEPNVGQLGVGIDYAARGSGFQVMLSRGGFAVTIGGGHPVPGRARASGAVQTRLEVRLDGARGSTFTPRRRLVGKVNSFIGRDPRRWRVGIPTYGAVRAASIYPGIDAEYYGRGHRLEYDFIVHPGANPAAIRLRLSDARDVELGAKGDLVARVRGHVWRQLKPVSYQRIAGHRREVRSRYVLHQNGTVGISLGRFDHSRRLVIDPVIAWSSYLGGAGQDYADAVAAGLDLSAYVVGFTTSGDFQTHDAMDSTLNGGQDAFVTRISPDGHSVLFSTYLGSTDNWDGADSVAVDRAGYVYVAGSSAGHDFPTAGNPYSAASRVNDLFVAKLRPDGSGLVYSTKLGGSGMELGAYGLAVDSAGSAYVAGRTGSVDFPTVNAYQSQHVGSGDDGFVTKVSASGSSLVYSTYLGSSSADEIRSLALGSDNTAYVAGRTAGSDFPTTAGATQPFPGGSWDGAVARLSADGRALLASTYFGGSLDDEFNAISVDAGGSAYVAGNSVSTDFPLRSPLVAQRGPTSAGVVVKLGSNLGTVGFSTYLTGQDVTDLTGIAVDPDNTVYVAGYTNGPGYPVTATAPQQTNAGGYAGVVTALRADGQQYLFSTYIGGSRNETLLGLGLGWDGSIYGVGYSTSTDYPRIAAAQTSYGGGDYDGIAFRITALDPNRPWAVDPLDPAKSVGATFRPILRFDSNESWRPLNVDHFLAEVDPTRPNQPYNAVCDATSCNTVLQANASALMTRPHGFVQVGSLGPGGHGGNPDDYRSPEPQCGANELWDCDSGPESGIYYHSVQSPSSDYRWLDFWTYYRFNDLKGSDHHEGDWEGLVIAVNGAAAPAFDAVGFAQHTGVTWLTPGVLTCDSGGQCARVDISSINTIQVTNIGKRVHVFVADGSHAAYGRACASACRQDENPLFPEGDHDGTQYWGANSDPRALIRFPDSVNSWTDWTGRWGGSCAPDFNCSDVIQSCTVSPPCNSPQNPSLQRRYKCPSRGNPFVIEPCATATLRRIVRRERAQVERLTASRCGNWFARSLTSVACSSSRLRRAVARGSLSKGVTFAFEGRHRAVGAVAGVSQVTGSALGVGEVLQLRGTTPHDTLVAVRVGARRRVRTVVFRHVALRRSVARISVVTTRTGPTAQLSIAGVVRGPDKIGRIEVQRSRRR